MKEKTHHERVKAYLESVIKMCLDGTTISASLGEDGLFGNDVEVSINTHDDPYHRFIMRKDGSRVMLDVESIEQLTGGSDLKEIINKHYPGYTSLVLIGEGAVYYTPVIFLLMGSKWVDGVRNSPENGDTNYQRFTKTERGYIQIELISV